MTDGHKTVISHHCEEKGVQPCKEHEKIHLGDSDFIGYNFALVLDVLQHIWNGGGSDTDVYKGQVGGEEVHEGVGVEAGLTARMMSRFPNTVIRYMERKCPK